ncbi:MAG: polysaccharide deacetylase family protein [Anaerolineales bacterium]|nr:polysaccharide deacetylase family protein [Anaerolineales bacterium]
MPSQKCIGYFILSLDTELGIGYYDLDEKRHAIFSPDGSRERESIRRLLELFEKYEIRATWAIVGHMMFETCEFCEWCPVKNWQGKYQSYEEAYGTSHPLWYGKDMVDLIYAHRDNNEIGFHGYTHEVFSDSAMSMERTQKEILEWKRLASRWGIEPASIVFPRDRVGNLKIFQQAGFRCFRSDRTYPLWERVPYLGKFIKTLDRIFGITSPNVYSLDQNEITQGLVNMQSSEHFFDLNRHIKDILDNAGLSFLHTRRTLRAVRKAMRQGKAFHLWAHPWTFQSNHDFEKLEKVLQLVKQGITNGHLKSVTMQEYADLVLANDQLGED